MTIGQVELLLGLFHCKVQRFDPQFEEALPVFRPSILARVEVFQESQENVKFWGEQHLVGIASINNSSSSIDAQVS